MPSTLGTPADRTPPSRSSQPSAGTAASDAATEQRATSADSTGGVVPVSCAAIAGQHGSRSLRAICTHLQQVLRPGTTSGPTSAVVSRTCTNRCGTPRTPATTSGTGMQPTGATTASVCGADVFVTTRSAPYLAVARTTAEAARLVPSGSSAP